MKYFYSYISGYETDSLLDIGCGKGLLFENIQETEKYRFLVGVDLMRKKQERYQHVVADVTRLPFKGKLFLLVTAFSLLKHVLEAERSRLYKEICRVIKNDGTVVIQLPNRYSVIESHTFLPFFGFLPSRMHSFAYRGGYVAVPSLKNVVASLNRDGFTIQKIEKYEAPFLPFGRLLSRVGFYRLSPMGYVIHARIENTRPESSAFA